MGIIKGVVIASGAKQSLFLDCFVAEFILSNAEGLLAMTTLSMHS